MGLYVSSKSQKEFAPEVAQWVKERSIEQEEKPS